ncbi:MAG: DUF4166 domain-containing protein [Leptospiraceae bacterium]|nr:DUF4166 domain-containing protein [Leptospiraceae bacterium]
MTLRIIQTGFVLAAVYNLIWGLVIVLNPDLFFRPLGLPPARYPFLVAGIGLFVALYACGYYLVAARPDRYPVLALIGWLGKTLGPLGWWMYVQAGALPLRSMWINVGNDLIWLPLFGLYFFWLNSSARFAAGRAYSALPGWKFTHLPSALRDFHGRTDVVHAQGRFWIRRGRGGLARMLAALGGFRTDAEARELRLTVRPLANGEVWIRDFDGRPRFITRQFTYQSLLYEVAGPLIFEFRLEFTHTGFVFVQQRCLLRWLWLDVWPAPCIKARVRAASSGWVVRVGVHVPVIGRILTYGGRVWGPTN